jgi:hypothetical protein
VNQFLAAHQVQYLYTGTLQAGSSAWAGSTEESSSAWFAQKFTAGASQVLVGYVQMHLALLTGSPPPWVISLQADSGGAPSGTPIVSAVLPAELAGGTSWVTVPLPAAVTASGAYWIVAPVTGDGSDWFGWSVSGAGSGASISSNGTAWAAQAFGMAFQVYDQSPGGPLAATWEDSGARWTAPAYGSGGQLTGLGEYTAGQAPGAYAASSRTLAWAGGLLTGVA